MLFRSYEEWRIGLDQDQVETLLQSEPIRIRDYKTGNEQRITFKNFGVKFATLTLNSDSTIKQNKKKFIDNFGIKLSELYKSMDLLRINSAAYFATGEENKGAATAEVFSNISEIFVSAHEEQKMFKKKKGYIQTQKVAAKNETKSLKDLDKLIERVILNKMNK